MGDNDSRHALRDNQPIPERPAPRPRFKRMSDYIGMSVQRYELPDGRTEVQYYIQLVDSAANRVVPIQLASSDEECPHLRCWLRSVVALADQYCAEHLGEPDTLLVHVVEEEADPLGS